MNGPGWVTYVLVAAGGALGTLARYGLNLWVGSRFGTALPWPLTTFAINVTGSFLIGLVAGLAVTGAFGIGPPARAVLAVGILGGFTTFSSFSLEVLEALEAGRAATAFAYAAASVTLGVCGAAGGVAVARLVR